MYCLDGDRCVTSPPCTHQAAASQPAEPWWTRQRNWFSSFQPWFHLLLSCKHKQHPDLNHFQNISALKLLTAADLLKSRAPKDVWLVSSGADKLTAYIKPWWTCASFHPESLLKWPLQLGSELWLWGFLNKHVATRLPAELNLLVTHHKNRTRCSSAVKLDFNPNLISSKYLK